MFEDIFCVSLVVGNKIKRKFIVVLIGFFDFCIVLYIGGIFCMFNVFGISGIIISGELSFNSYVYLYCIVFFDIFFVKVMVDIIEYFNWSYVVVVGFDDLYGRGGVWFLVNEVMVRKYLFCIVMIEFICYEV